MTKLGVFLNRHCRYSHIRNTWEAFYHQTKVTFPCTKNSSVLFQHYMTRFIGRKKDNSGDGSLFCFRQWCALWKSLPGSKLWQAHITSLYIQYILDYSPGEVTLVPNTYSKVKDNVFIDRYKSCFVKALWLRYGVSINNKVLFPVLTPLNLADLFILIARDWHWI